MSTILTTEFRIAQEVLFLQCELNEKSPGGNFYFDGQHNESLLNMVEPFSLIVHKKNTRFFIRKSFIRK